MARPAINDAARYALRYYQEKYGMQPFQAAGIVGNLFQESTMNTGARNPGDGRDGSDSIGIGQWNGDRAKAMRSYAGDKVSNLDTQLDFVVHEMKNGPERRAYDQLMASKDVHGATSAMIGYERPQGWTVKNPTAGHGWDNRIGVAQELLGMSPEEIAAARPSASSSVLDISNQAQAQATPAQVLEIDEPAATATAAEDKPLIDLPKVEEVLGVDTAKAGKGLAAVGKQFAEQTEAMNKQVPKGGLIASKPFEVSMASSMAPPQLNAPSSGGEMDPLEMLRMLMMRRDGGRGGLI